MSLRSKDPSMKVKRRKFVAASLLSAGLVAYSLNRGVRMPPLIWEPRELPDQFDNASLTLLSRELIHTSTPAIDARVDMSLRAFAPEPALKLSSKGSANLALSINNISPEAELSVSTACSAVVEEEIIGITRLLKITTQGESTLELNFTIDVSNGYRFAAIGDTGGQRELQWSLQRAKALGALFFLHLGDFYYTEGDYENAISLFNSAQIPSYVSIGNHDFHDGKTVYKKFLADIGPFNSTFSFGNVRFANIDTASGLVPWNKGQRGDLIRQLQSEQNNNKSNIAFTHRPLFDPIENSSHDIGNYAERDWLIDGLKKAGFNTLISGHIHIHARDVIQGVDNIIVGQGLGHQDLITNQDYSKMAVGKVSPSGRVDFEFANLSMPWELHCHPRNDIVKESLSDSPHIEKIMALDTLCKQP